MNGIAACCSFAILVLAASAPSIDAGWASFHARMTSALTTLQVHFREIEKRTKMAPTLQERLDADSATQSLDQPDDMSVEIFLDYAQTLAKLDSNLIDQLVAGKAHDVGAVRGVDDVPFLSSVDGTMQPLALFVPPSYDPNRPAPLVLFLHGRTITEAEVIAFPWIRAEAIATGAIVAAPYARGDIEYADPAPAEIYQSVDIVEHAFNIDRHRIFLAGHSVGGFGVFTVAPIHPDVWAGLLCVSGGMTEEDKRSALRGVAGKPVYVVEGSKDPVIPPPYAKRTVEWLQQNGIKAGYYEQPGGAHGLGSIREALSHAWRDMLAGITSHFSVPTDLQVRFTYFVVSIRARSRALAAAFPKW